MIFRNDCKAIDHLSPRDSTEKFYQIRAGEEEDEDEDYEEDDDNDDEDYDDDDDEDYDDDDDEDYDEDEDEDEE